MSSLAQDVRFALRSFAAHRGFAAAAIVSLAIGVGANSAIFSVASALLLRPLPYRDASRLAILWSRSPGLGIAEDWFATMLLIGAGLLIRSFARLQRVPPGFNASNMLPAESMTGRRYNDTQVVLETYRQLWDRLSHLPGAGASGGVSALPLSQMFAWGPITVEAGAAAR